MWYAPSGRFLQLNKVGSVYSNHNRSLEGRYNEKKIKIKLIRALIHSGFFFVLRLFTHYVCE